MLGHKNGGSCSASRQKWKLTRIFSLFDIYSYKDLKSKNSFSKSSNYFLSSGNHDTSRTYLLVKVLIKISAREQLFKVIKSYFRGIVKFIENNDFFAGVVGNFDSHGLNSVQIPINVHLCSYVLIFAFMYTFLLNHHNTIAKLLL